RDCSGEGTPDRKIAACTHILEDAKSPPALRATAYRERGITYSKRGLHELATADFDEALKINPQDNQAQGMRGKAYAQRGQYDRAIADFTEVTRRNPKSDRAYNDRGL